MDNGSIVEFDAPEVLHGQNGVFRSMCDHSNITLDDIRCARIEPRLETRLEVSFILNLDNLRIFSEWGLDMPSTWMTKL